MAKKKGSCSPQQEPFQIRLSSKSSRFRQRPTAVVWLSGTPLGELEQLPSLSAYAGDDVRHVNIPLTLSMLPLIAKGPS